MQRVIAKRARHKLSVPALAAYTFPCRTSVSAEFATDFFNRLFTFLTDGTYFTKPPVEKHIYIVNAVNLFGEYHERYDC
jgi:hypothetical protein